MNAVQKIVKGAQAKYALAGTTLAATAMTASASDIWDNAVTQLTNLLVGVAAVGTAVLAISVTAVGFWVIKRLVQRA